MQNYTNDREITFILAYQTATTIAHLLASLASLRDRFLFLLRSLSRAIFHVAQRFREFSLYEPLSIVDISTTRAAVGPAACFSRVNTVCSRPGNTRVVLVFFPLSAYLLFSSHYQARCFHLVQLHENRYEIII